MEEAIDWGERALEMAEQFDDVEVRIQALNNIATATCFLGRSGGIYKYKQSLALALENNLHEHAARVYTNLTERLIEFREFASAESFADEGIAFDTEHDLDAWTHYLVGRKALLRLDQGRLTDAEEIAEQVLALRQPTLLMRLPALIARAVAQMRLGKEIGPRLLGESLAQAISTDEIQYVVPVRIALMEQAWLADRPADCAIQLAELCKLEPQTIHRWNRGDICIWAKRLDIAPQAQPFAFDLPPVHSLELAGDCKSASHAWQQIGAPYHAALALAQSTIGRGDEYSKAARILSAIDAKGAFLRLKEMAREQGVPFRMPRGQRGPYKASRHHPMGLTGKEQAVLELRATGASNAEIASKLSRSARTIEHHVSSIISKLGVRNRNEAIAKKVVAGLTQNNAGQE